jgi:hypothetical protein
MSLPRDENYDPELSPQERELGQRISQATRYQMPVALRERLERELRRAEPVVVARPAVAAFERWRWAAIAAVVIIGVSLALVSTLLFFKPEPVSAAEITRRVAEASRKNLVDGAIVHRVYRIVSTFQGQTSTGRHEEWAQVLSNGLITHYKVIQDQQQNNQPSRYVLLYIKASGVNQFWNTATNTVYSRSTSNYQPNLNPIEDSASLVGSSQIDTNGTNRVIDSKLSEPDASHYLLSFYQEYTDPTGKVSYSRSEYYINRQSYEVEQVAIVGMQGKDGPDSADRYEGRLESTEQLPPDAGVSAKLFVLGAPSDAKMVKL